MTRRLVLTTAGLAATVGLLVGLVLAGNMTPAPANSAEPAPKTTARMSAPPAPGAPMPTSFADIAAQVNPAVVTVNASVAGRAAEPGRGFSWTATAT